MSAVCLPSEPGAEVLWPRTTFDKMVELGIFGPDDPIELLDGKIIRMAPQYSPHAAAISLVSEHLREVFGKGFFIRSQMPLALDDFSEPEPDVAAVTGSIRDFAAAHPTTAQLVVEVAQSTLKFDRGQKKAAYARNHIPEYWIVNLLERCIEVHRSPKNGAYEISFIVGEGQSVAPENKEDKAVPVSDLLP